MKKLWLQLIILLPGPLLAQSAFSGSVVDSAGEAVPYVTVIVQDADSIVTQAVLSDAGGSYVLEKGLSDGDMVIFQHLSYETALFTGAQVKGSGTITIREKENTIDDVVVKGERPLVTLVGNSLSYDAQALTKDRIVNSAFDVVRELPGITGSDDELELVGAGKFTIVINGQITSMSLPELYALLRSIPASQVRRLNLSYNAPAKYNFNGAVIEVELMDNTGYEGTTGELSAEYFNRFYSGGNIRGSVNVEKERFGLSFLGEAGRRKSLSGDEMYSRHFYNGDYLDVFHDTRSEGKPTNYSFRAAGDYRFDNSASLNISYYYSGTSSRRLATADNIFEGAGISRQVESSNGMKTDTHLHNIHLQYDGKFSAGADYTRYNSPDKGVYGDIVGGASQTRYDYKFSQKVDRLNVFANKTMTVGTWTMNYGMNFNTAWSGNNSDYLYHVLDFSPVSSTARTVSDQSEYFGNVFFEVSK